MSSKKKVVVLGGGYAGVLTAKKLANKFKRDDSIEITLIDRQSYHTMLTELHEVAAGRVEEDSIRIDLKKIFTGRKVNVVLDEITELDFKGQVLKSKDNSYKYDYLVVGTGCKPTYFGIPGAEEYTQKLWSYDDAANLKNHILTMFRKAMKETDKKEREKLLTFVVVGGGFTGIEMIGELAEWQDRLCEDFHIDKEEVKLYVVDALPTILPNLPANLIKKAERRLEKMNVKIVTGAGVTEVKKDSVTLGEKGTVDTYSVIWAVGVEGADIIEKMDVQQKGRKRIVTNDKLQSVDYKNVYVVGDNMFYIPEGEERPVPQMVENCEHSAPIAAHNIYTDIKGGQKKSYKPEFHGVMVCIGGRYGVAHLGLPGRFFGLSGFFAMFVKHFINLVYFFQVAGFNKCWSYMMHEIFHIKDRRSLVGGHLAKSSPNFWLVPLRLFIGYKWVEQGLHKLPGILKDPSKIFLIPAPPAADAVTGASQAAAETVQQAADAVSAASQVAEAAGEAASQWGNALPVPDFIDSIVKWSMDIFFYTPDGGFTVLAQVFQAGMVIAEVIVGLMLIAGLFSAAASVISVAMGMMIWASGMAPTEMLWYLTGGVALIGGSGSVFGLDYYVLPFLKKIWKKIGIVKKWYLYID
ncbi:NAD(P)/FAD-dependent oxidoreductase [Petroclostridium sp. X23]|uniref:NAD(P)/FAD-dependent oxidoreductase n=1 Tax=Petroclostridium sp. X23 TaxID=3045146 RepID=UPI0024AE0269|nr:NAD(P)/FAD-dependent oxidoreductase [Petroclostridium sp. X23]WHH61549.1 NAD(P)/FAD-dependent oxidoreductase [Petroclostridium sp. X23]